MHNTSAAFGLSFVVVSVLSAVLVVVKESYAPLLEWMKALTGHHWITHAVLVVVAYLALGLALSSIRKWNMTGRSLAAAVLVSTCASGLIVVGFFVYA
jgi:hypothetical protein